MSRFDYHTFRWAALTSADAEVEALLREVVSALEGDSVDAEHDALVSVAQFFGVEYNPDGGVF